jgi:hypothetical protein
MGTSRDPDGWATPPRAPRHAAPAFRLLALPRLVAWLAAGLSRVAWPLRVPRSVSPVGPFSPAAACRPVQPTGSRARQVLRIFVTTGISAAGLLLVVGFLVLVVPGGPRRTGPATASPSLSSDRHGTAPGGDRDRRSGLAQQPARPAGPRPVTYRRPAGHPTRADLRDRPGRSRSLARAIASFDGHGDMVTHRFAVSTKADWQIVWSYRCPARLSTGLLVVEDAVPGAVGAAISTSGTAGHGDTWLDPDGRSHRLVVISTCSWTMRVIQSG